MSNKEIRTRVQMKNDTAEAWQKASDPSQVTNVFVPLLGEPLLYREKDGDGWKFSMKVGDGVRTPEELPDFDTPNPRPDWNQTDETKEDYIKNKPIIDQTYMATSTNAQSGAAVAEGIVLAIEEAKKYTNNELAAAKESGEFDGEDGYTPVRGIDYWTDADKAEIKSYVNDAILNGEW